VGLREDLDSIFADEALEPVSVAVGGSVASAYLDDPQALIEGAGGGLEGAESMQVGDRVIRLRTGALAGLVRHAVVVVTDPAAGTVTSYRVRDCRPTDDGLITLAWLVPV
jgi:hypothetical protein